MARTGIDVNLVVDAADDDLAGRLAALEVESAWVTASAARTQEPEASDEQLFRACNGSPSLHPLPVLVPPVSALGAYERARAIAATADLRVVRLCPAGHAYPLAEWVVSPLPELCERERLALVLDFEPQAVPWSEVVSFARAYPSVPMVVLGVDLGTDPVVAAALDAAPNLVIEIGLSSEGADLVRFADTYGPSRFVWGSGGGDGALAVREAIAGLGEEARAAILGENARALADGSYAERFL